MGPAWRGEDQIGSKISKPLILLDLARDAQSGAMGSPRPKTRKA
jgi:hypothetical protein